MQRLGQHFLKNKPAITKIIAALELKKGNAVIEIGPGKGALTIPLARKCAEIGCKIVAVEKDAELGSRVQGLGFREILEVQIGDALKLLPKIAIPYTLYPIPYKVVGNIPYYITGHLLRVISELPVKPWLTVLMVQKEVAERVCAKPPKMNLLAAATQIWADASILFTLKQNDFDPPPEVESAVIKLRQANSDKRQVNTEEYYQLIHAAFKQPRKTLLNNLIDSDKRTATSDKEKHDAIEIMQREKFLAILAKFGFNEKTRAQELSVEQLGEMGRELGIRN